MEGEINANFVSLPTLTEIAKNENEWRRMANYLGAKDIDDVVQSMYLKLAEINKADGNLSRISKNKKINTSYIFRILQSIIVDCSRFEKRSQIDEIVLTHPLKPSDELEDSYIQLMDGIRTSITEIPEHEQNILEMYFVYGYSIRRLSKITGLGIGTIFQSLKKSKKHIKENINEKFNNYSQAKAEKETIERVGRSNPKSNAKDWH